MFTDYANSKFVQQIWNSFLISFSLDKICENVIELSKSKELLAIACYDPNKSTLHCRFGPGLKCKVKFNDRTWLYTTAIKRIKDDLSYVKV